MFAIFINTALNTFILSGNPPRSSTAQIAIAVLDVNDNQPIFGQDNYEGNVEENMDIGETILRVSLRNTCFGEY